MRGFRTRREDYRKATCLIAALGMLVFLWIYVQFWRATMGTEAPTAAPVARVDDGATEADATAPEVAIERPASAAAARAGSILGGRARGIVARETQPIPGRRVSVIPGHLFGSQLAREALDGEWMSLKRVDEEGTPFFAWFGQHAIGQDPLLNYLRNPGSDEERIRGLFNRVLREDAALAAKSAGGSTPGEEPLVLDVGANMGYYSLLSAARGFRSLAFEPQPHCHQFLKSAALLSGFQDRLTLVAGLVGDEPGAEATVEVRTGCWGTWPIGDQDVLSKIPDPPPPVVVGEVGVDELLEALFTRRGREIPRVPLMKVDTEGYEFRVLRSARKLLASGKVRNLVVELNSNFYYRSKSGPEDAEEMFRYLHGLGYRMQCIDTAVGFSEKVPTPWEGVVRRAQTLKDPYSVDCWWYASDG